jgi:hypothetical protein
VLTQEALREVACRGSQFHGFPPCRPGRYDAEAFAFEGWNQASGHSPPYYVITGIAARALRAATPVGGLVAAARMLGAVWLLVGLYLTLRAAELLGVARSPTMLALVLVAAVPSVLHASTTVNPDVAGVVGGAAVLLAALAWERTGRDLIVLGVASFACAALDTTNVFGVAVVLAYLLLRAVSLYRGQGGGHGRHWREYAAPLGVVAGSAVLAVFGWKIVYSLLSHDVDLSNHPSRVTFRVDGLGLDLLLGRDTLFAVFPPVDGYIAPVLAKAPYRAFVGAAIVVALGALVATAFRFQLTSRLSAIGLATLLALLATPPILAVYNYWSDGLYFPILTRQALSAFPALAIVIAGVASTKMARVLLGTTAVGLYLAAVITLV